MYKVVEPKCFNLFGLSHATQIDQTRKLKIGEISILSENRFTSKLLCQLRYKALLFSVYICRFWGLPNAVLARDTRVFGKIFFKVANKYSFLVFLVAHLRYKSSVTDKWCQSSL